MPDQTPPERLVYGYISLVRYAHPVRTDLDASVCLRWRHEEIAQATSHLVRVRHRDEVTLALLANAGESGFSTFWLSGSRLLLDEFERAWDAGTGPLDVRLADAFAAASTSFCENAATLLPPDPDIPGGFAYGTLLAVAIAGSRVEIAWVGGARAVLVRGDAAEASTRPHTLLEQLREAGLGPPRNASWPFGILARTIGPGNTNDAGPNHARFELLPGDTLALLSSPGMRKPPVGLNIVAKMVGLESDLDAAASNVTSAEYTNSDPSFAACAVLRRQG